MWIVYSFIFSVVWGILATLALVAIICLLQKLFNLDDSTTEKIFYFLGGIIVVLSCIIGYWYGLSYLV